LNLFKNIFRNFYLFLILAIFIACCQAAIITTTKATATTKTTTTTATTTTATTTTTTTTTTAASSNPILKNWKTTTGYGKGYGASWLNNAMKIQYSTNYVYGK
jgi:hypothetical protein